MIFNARLLAAASAVALAGTLANLGANAASAAPLSTGTCSDSVLLVKHTPALTDQTQTGVKTSGGLAKDVATHDAASPGTCTGMANRPGDAAGAVGGDLTVKSASWSLVGNQSCNTSDAARSQDATIGNTWPATGKVSYKFNELGANSKNFGLTAYVTLLGQDSDPSLPDVYDYSGLVIQGVDLGAVISGKTWIQPVVKGNTDYGDPYNTGYGADFVDSFGCADTVTGNATVPYEEIGDGDNVSPLVGTELDSGMNFSVGQ